MRLFVFFSFRVVIIGRSGCPQVSTSIYLVLVVVLLLLYCCPSLCMAIPFFFCDRFAFTCCLGVQARNPSFLGVMGVKLDLSTHQQIYVAGDVVEGSVRVDVTTVSGM